MKKIIIMAMTVAMSIFAINSTYADTRHHHPVYHHTRGYGYSHSNTYNGNYNRRSGDNTRRNDNNKGDYRNNTRDNRNRTPDNNYPR